MYVVVLWLSCLLAEMSFWASCLLEEMDLGEMSQCRDHCGFQAMSLAAMATHNKENHSAAKVFMCDQCEYSFTREEYLRKHIKFHHDGETRSDL